MLPPSLQPPQVQTGTRRRGPTLGNTPPQLAETLQAGITGQLSWSLWPAGVTMASWCYCDQLMAQAGRLRLVVHCIDVQGPGVPAPLRWRFAAGAARRLVGRHSLTS